MVRMRANVSSGNSFTVNDTLMDRDLVPGRRANQHRILDAKR